MKRYLKWLLAGFGVIVIGVAGLVFAFYRSMQPDPDEEAKVMKMAESYVLERFKDAEVTEDVLFDNMGNFPFEYAAIVVDSVTGTEFYVYENESTGEIVDTFLSSKWEDAVTEAIEDSIDTAFGADVTYVVLYDEESIRQLDVSSANPIAYQTADVSPTIILTLHREPEADDEERVRTWMSALQENDILKRAEIRVDYTAKNGELLDDGTGLDLSF
ncbi:MULTISPECIES: hypothetical protein [unclassified Exiguobacterium]|uniref:hypothetical protein n=1 Tax=unclassified Exiguobacterium TaxID=2644629 RepID=UPI0021F4AC41|nr:MULTISPECIES: hypothetical protein [unclassified Exiguobacterium]MCV9899898.1 hypothetical protein [Exiguobacterium sp. N5]MDT0192139.1 hypothetical protein [Exiguobacterium sp. BG5(2022)]